MTHNKDYGILKVLIISLNYRFTYETVIVQFFLQIILTTTQKQKTKKDQKLEIAARKRRVSKYVKAKKKTKLQKKEKKRTRGQLQKGRKPKEKR